MNKLTLIIASAAVALALPAIAATNTTAPVNKMTATKTAPMKAAPAKMASANSMAPAKAKGPATTEAKTPEGKACSAQADSQGLHGAARKAFRSKCKDAAKSAEKAGTTAAPSKK